jgi:hypothetical protein
MVDISTELQVIDNAVYGKDMRRAIRDALQKLADAINQGGGGSAGVKVMHVRNHEEHLNFIMNQDLGYDDIALVDSDMTIMSHVTKNEQGRIVVKTYTDSETHEVVHYVGELYGRMRMSEGEDAEESNESNEGE